MIIHLWHRVKKYWHVRVWTRSRMINQITICQWTRNTSLSVHVGTAKPIPKITANPITSMRFAIILMTFWFSYSGRIYHVLNERFIRKNGKTHYLFWGNCISSRNCDTSCNKYTYIGYFHKYGSNHSIDFFVYISWRFVSFGCSTFCVHFWICII